MSAVSRIERRSLPNLRFFFPTARNREDKKNHPAAETAHILRISSHEIVNHGSMICSRESVLDSIRRMVSRRSRLTFDPCQPHILPISPWERFSSKHNLSL